MIRDEDGLCRYPIDFCRSPHGRSYYLRVGSEEMKKEFLPRIAKGEVEFCLGYTERKAASDLVALKDPG